MLIMWPTCDQLSSLRHTIHSISHCSGTPHGVCSTSLGVRMLSLQSLLDHLRCDGLCCPAAWLWGATL